MRYKRQIAFIGRKAQEGLKRARVCIVGCGGLGSNSAELLARAGVGYLRIIDGDVVELHNLHRMRFYTEADAKKGAKKAEVAKERIGRINSEVAVEAVCEKLRKSNALSLIEGVDLVIDGLDSLKDRLLLNEACVKNNIPWVHAAVIQGRGYVTFIIPKQTPCLACFIPALLKVESPRRAGILPTAPAFASALQVSEAIRFLIGKAPTLCNKLFYFDFSQARFEIIEVERNRNCKVCQQVR